MAQIAGFSSPNRGASTAKESSFGGKNFSKEGEVVYSALGSGMRDALLDCHPLMTITPSDNNLELVFPVELDKDNQLLCVENSLQISRWVKYRILGFSILVGLPLNRYEARCCKG